MGGIVSASVSSASVSSINKSFLHGPTIGEGSYSIIRRTTHIPTKSQFAMKCIDIEQCVSSDTHSAVHAFNELTALKRLTHSQFICNLYYAHHDYRDFTLILDLLEGGDLRYHLNDNVHFTEYDVGFIGACIASALNHMHNLGVIHRDVKPENIVLDGQGYPRLTDFGISHTSASSLVCTSYSGTVGYMAPEILTTVHAHSIECDFWSLGVVMFELLFSERPFHGNCPGSFVSFVENTYSGLWNMDRYIHIVCDTDTTQASIRTNIDDISFKSKEGSLLDCGDDARCNRNINTINLSKSMMLRVPTMTHRGNRVSAAFVSVIRGLMDVRVPQRLGAGSNYTNLQHHSFFRLIKWNDLYGKKVISPLHIDVNITRLSLENKYTEKSLKSVVKSPVNTTKLPRHVQEILQDYSHDTFGTSSRSLKKMASFNV